MVHQRRITLSDNKYPTFFGSVEFEPETRDANGKSIRQLTIKLANNSAETKVRITIWPELKAPEVKKGDFVAVSGKYEVKDSQDGSRQFHNLSATSIAVLGGTVKDGSAPSVVSKGASTEPAF